MVILTAQDWLRAVKNGQLEKLQMLRRQKCPVHKESSQSASKRGHWEIVKWLHITGKSPVNAKTFVHAVEFKNIKMLNWLHHKGYECPSQALTVAIMRGYTEIVDWLLEHKCIPNVKTVNAAVCRGDYELLDLLLKHGAPKDESAVMLAAINKNFNLLKYLDWLNFPLTQNTLKVCSTQEMYDWAQCRLDEQDLIFYLEMNSKVPLHV